MKLDRRFITLTRFIRFTSFIESPTTSTIASASKGTSHDNENAAKHKDHGIASARDPQAPASRHKTLRSSCPHDWPTLPEVGLHRLGALPQPRWCRPQRTAGDDRQAHRPGPAQSKLLGDCRGDPLDLLHEAPADRSLACGSRCRWCDFDGIAPRSPVMPDAISEVLCACAPRWGRHERAQVHGVPGACMLHCGLPSLL